MDMEKQARLVRHLFRKTNEDDLEWQTSAAGTFVVSFRNNGVQLRRGDTGAQSPIFFVDLINDQGEVVETFDDEDLDRAATAGTGGEYFQLLGNLFELARRSAMGSDKVLNDLLKELDDEIPF